MFSGVSEQANTQIKTSILAAAGALSLLIGIFAAWGGYQLGVRSVEPAAQEDQTVAALQDLFDLERQKLGDLRNTTNENLNAIALRMGQLQARILRLDALGERLSKMGQLDQSEFNFGTIPPHGGPDSAASGGQTELGSLISDLEILAATVDDREQKLLYIEDLIMNRNLQKEVSPTGRPIKKGWISSYFGMRKDPFTGKQALHKGVDFAGKLGSDVVAVASGIVTYARKKSGYGYLVEIQHGKGYATRYGHNAEILVQVGERVEQGQTIGKMGSSGRSTGPHVHFEVLRNGKSVNPAKYISASR